MSNKEIPEKVTSSIVNCPQHHQTKWNQHPVVTFKLIPNKPRACPYCSRTYLYQPDPK